jgi:hypothetical protein
MLKFPQSLHQVDLKKGPGQRREFLEKAPAVFEDKRKRVVEPEPGHLVANLYQQIGQQKVELDFSPQGCASR